MMMMTTMTIIIISNVHVITYKTLLLSEKEKTVNFLPDIFCYLIYLNVQKFVGILM
jgi:hypothetical protein